MSPPDDTLQKDGPDDARAALRQLMRLLVKIALVGPEAQARPWGEEARAAQGRVARDAEALAGVRLDGLWTLAVRDAERDPDVRRGETVNPTLPTAVPFRLDVLSATPFDLDGAVQTIRDTASFG